MHLPKFLCQTHNVRFRIQCEFRYFKHRFIESPAKHQWFISEVSTERQIRNPECRKVICVLHFMDTAKYLATSRILYCYIMIYQNRCTQLHFVKKYFINYIFLTNRIVHIYIYILLVILSHSFFWWRKAVSCGGRRDQAEDNITKNTLIFFTILPCHNALGI